MIDMYTVCQRLILHEGLRLQPYFCSKNKLTIGVGRCIQTNPITSEEEKVMGLYDYILELFIKYYYIVLPIIIVSGSAGIIILSKKKKDELFY